MKFKKKPVIVDAVQWCGLNSQIVVPGVTAYDPYGEQKRNCDYCKKSTAEHGWVMTLEGGHIVCPGDWIITGVNGEKYPCKPDIFEKTYEKVEEKK